MGDCIHHWKVSKPAPGEFLAGICKCGAWRLFEALAPSTSGWKHTGKGQEKRPAESHRKVKA